MLQIGQVSWKYNVLPTFVWSGDCDDSTLVQSISLQAEDGTELVADDYGFTLRLDTSPYIRFLIANGATNSVYLTEESLNRMSSRSLTLKIVYTETVNYTDTDQYTASLSDSLSICVEDQCDTAGFFDISYTVPD